MPAPLDLGMRQGMASLDAQTWDGLHDSGHPFVEHAFLSLLERSGSLRGEYGWHPRPLLLGDPQPRAGAPHYLKTNSHGEFVFDQAWARFIEAEGQAYYPKMLIGVPYSPVPGPRLLARSSAAREELIAGIETLCIGSGLSSAHINFVRADEHDALRAAGWIERHDLQFHWHNHGYRDFQDFLERFSSKKRKNVRQERARVQDSGVRIERVTGSHACDATLRDVARLYRQTFELKGNLPALSETFFLGLPAVLGDRLKLVVARIDQHIIAMALLISDRETLHGRYWGCDIEIPGLHFELCYYQAIEWAIELGLQRVEPGAQGQHKLARGFLPTRVHSFHYIAHPGLRAPIADYCRRERAEVREWQQELARHAPFRLTDAIPD